MPEIHSQLRRSLDQHALWPAPGQPALLAASGGADSSALARLLAPALRQRGHHAALAWFDHGWAAPAPARRVVEGLASELDLPLVSGRGRPDRDAVRRLGREGDARAQRLGFLFAEAERRGAVVYLGHHRDDDLETSMLRGASMPRARGPLRRPALDLSRAELRATLPAGSWCEDPANKDPSFARVALRQGRLRSLPMGEADAILVRGRARRAQLDARARDASEALVGMVRGAGLDRAALAALDRELARAALQLITSSPTGAWRTPSRAALDALLGALTGGPPSGSLDLGSGWTAELLPTSLQLVRGRSHDVPVAARLTPGAQRPWPDLGVVGLQQLSASAALRWLRSLGADAAVLDADSVDGPLTLRPGRSDDRLAPYGMEGSRALRDVLSTTRVPRSRRGGWPVVCDARGRLLWVVGRRASRHAPLHPSSRRALLLYLSAPASPRGRGLPQVIRK